MIIQAICKLPLVCRDSCVQSRVMKGLTISIALLDDLDRELNNYSMRCREWYGWHFPELGKIVTDNLTYARAVKAIGEGKRVCSRPVG